MKIQIISLFPEMFKAVLNQSMMFKAQKIGAVEFELIGLARVSKSMIRHMVAVMGCC